MRKLALIAAASFGLIALLAAVPSNAFLFRAGAPAPPVVFPASTPFMGWNSYYNSNIAITQTKMQAVSDWLAANMAQYNVVMLDEGWAASRDGGGNLVANSNFPSMSGLAAHIKANGQHPTIYSDGGIDLCGQSGAGLGTWNHQTQDATQFFGTWGYQGIKLDGCGVGTGGPPVTVDPKVAGTDFRSAILATGQSIIYSPVFGTSSAHVTGSWEWATYEGASAYSGANIDPGTGLSDCSLNGTGNAPFQGAVLNQIWVDSYHPGSSMPGHFHHEFYIATNSPSLNADEQLSSLLVTVMIPSPMIIMCDPRTFSAGQITQLTNSEVIAVDQEPWVLGGYKFAGANGGGGFGSDGTWEAYVRWTQNSGERYILLINDSDLGNPNDSITVNPSTVGITGTYNLRDVVANSNICTGCSGTITATGVPPHGSKLYKLSNGTETKATCWAVNAGGSAAASSGAPGSCGFAQENVNWTALCNGGFGGSFNGTTCPYDGTAITTATAITTTGLTNPAPQAVYQAGRTCTAALGNTNGECPIEYFANNLVIGATYKVRLHFAEIAKTGAGQREFNVRILNGVTDTQVLNNFDIFADAGGEFIGDIKEFNVVASHGVIAVHFDSGAADFPLINGIEVIKQ